jgi:hypothetical protein
VLLATGLCGGARWKSKPFAPFSGVVLRAVCCCKTGVLGTQGEVALGLASLGVEFSEEAVEPVTGYRVDMLLQGGDGTATGRCAVEVGIDILIVILVAHHYH